MQLDRRLVHRYLAFSWWCICTFCPATVSCAGQESKGFWSGHLRQGDSDLEVDSCAGYGYGLKRGRPLVNDLVDRELTPRLGTETYLDYTGSGVYLNSQAAAIAQDLQSTVYGNPHSVNPSSRRTTQLVEQTRRKLLQWFGADPQQYTLIFTRSATGGLQALGELFPWSPSSRFAYLVSNHNSVLGIRQYAKAGGSRAGALTVDQVEAWLAGGGASSGSTSSSEATSSGAGGVTSGNSDSSAGSIAGGGGRRRKIASIDGGDGSVGGGGGSSSSGSSHGDGTSSGRERASAELDLGACCTGPGADGGPDGGAGTTTFSLFAYPAQDNFAGVLHPLRWVAAAQARSCARHKWKVLLDAAAYVPTHPLNLTETPADFVAISFYKIFGLPTGVGAWIVRTQDAAMLKEMYWGGGSVFPSTSRLQWHIRADPPYGFEHGTPPFLEIAALQHGMDALQSVGGMEAIRNHVACVKQYLYSLLSRLRYPNGSPLLRIFGKHGQPDSRLVQGGIVNFELLGPDGELLSFILAAKEMSAAGFHIRDGCMCNPGACFGYTGVADEEVRDLAVARAGNWTDWEWVWVDRDVEDAELAGEPALGTQPGQRQRVKRALGSLRASVGWLSRYEDADALADWLQQRYIGPSSGPPTGKGSSSGFGAGRTRGSKLLSSSGGERRGRGLGTTSEQHSSALRLLLYVGAGCLVLLLSTWLVRRRRQQGVAGLMRGTHRRRLSSPRAFGLLGQCPP